MAPGLQRTLTNSEIKTRRRCAREHHYSYELGYRSARSDAHALRFGTMIHAGLNAWWATLPATRDQRLAAALATIPSDADPFDTARAVEMLSGYDARWGAANTLATLAVEHEFRAPLRHPVTGDESRRYIVGGKMDAIVQDQLTGKVYVLEHKTSSDDIEHGSDYWQQLRLDSQVSTYFAAARGLGLDPAGVIYDVLGKPQLVPLKATPLESRRYRKDGTPYANTRERDESPDEYQARVRESIAEAPDRYFVRGTVARLESDETEAALDLWHHARAIHDAERAQAWPRNPDGCRRYGRMCAYFSVCTGAASLDDPALFIRTDRIHAELSE